jgi:hypothetical protein
MEMFFFSKGVQTGSGIYQTSCPLSTGCVSLTTHLRPVSRLRMGGAITPFFICIYGTHRKNCTYFIVALPVT